MREMKPGEEFDMLVAEKVMGCYRNDMGIFVNSEGCYKGEIPKYSTDISAAWKVVEKMRTRGNEFYQRSTGHNKWLAQFKSLYGSGYIAKTAPEAICKAALLAMEDKA